MKNIVIKEFISIKVIKQAINTIILKEKQIPFILFVSTESVGKKGYMNWNEILEISKEDLKEIQQIIRDEIEAMTKKGKTIDLGRLGKYIRREQASLFFDLFKKRGVWMT